MKAKYQVGDCFRHKNVDLLDKIEVVGINHKDRLYNMKYIHEGLIEEGGEFYFFDIDFDQVDELYEKIEELLTHCEKQLVLYSKNHFKKRDLIQDLAVLAGKQYALEPGNVSPYSIYHFVVEVYFKLVEKGYIKGDMKQFLLSLFKSTKDQIDYKNVIEKMLSEISLVKVKGLHLGKADESLLQGKTK